MISDEVYERLTFDGQRHRPLACLPGMAERTVTISSAAKMFNCTGWKIGWACGAPELVAGVRAAKQYLSYVGGAPFQPAVAYALNNEDAWVDGLRDSLQAKRDKLAAALTGLGFEVHDSSGTYFLCVDPRPLGFTDSTAFCEELPRRAGVAAIPMSAFCDPASRPPRRGNTWCASRSANATRPWTRRSGAGLLPVAALLAHSALLDLQHLLAQAVGGGVHRAFDGLLDRNPGSGIERSISRSNRTLVLSPCGVSVYLASCERSWPALISVQPAVFSPQLYSTVCSSLIPAALTFIFTCLGRPSL